MKGLEESKKFYLDAGKDMIHNLFPDYESRICVGLVGHGSECFGFDDEISRDHDFLTGFAMWLTKEDEEQIGFKLTREYNKLQQEYTNGAKEKHLSVGGYNSQGVQTIGEFYKRYTGYEGAPKTWQDWLYIDSEFLAEATNGEIFRDDLKEFTSIRSEILNMMPEDVRLKKIASCAIKMAQTGQYNFYRCLEHKEDGAAMLALSDYVKSACQMIYLLNKKHCPYYKWMIKGVRSLDILSNLADPLEFLLTSENDNYGKNVKKEIIEDISLAVAKEIKNQGIGSAEGSYLEPYGYSIIKNIKNSEIRNLHILIG